MEAAQLSSPIQLDACLQAFVQATDEATAQALLDQLLTQHAEPVIRPIIKHKLRTYASPTGYGYQAQDANDLHGEIVLELLTRLHKCKAAPTAHAIEDFRKYTAVTAYHACAEYLRRHYPQRSRLRHRLRRLLSTQAGLALWQNAQGEWLAGFAAWQAENRPVVRNERYQQLSHDPPAANRAALPGQDVQRLHPGTVVAALFDWVGGPLELDDLMAALAVLWGVRDEVESLDAPSVESAAPASQLADPRVDVANEVTQRLYLQRVWEEVCQLPAPQRLALLLNLRDGTGVCVTALLPIAGIASIRQIAVVLELPPEEFYRLWGDLPLEDAKIAELLGMTRQQVINLRKSARERLGRRMRALEA